jgi:hypothetical protein
LDSDAVAIRQFREIVMLDYLQVIEAERSRDQDRDDQHHKSGDARRQLRNWSVFIPALKIGHGG